MKSAALGLRAHSGWSALVAVGLDKGETVVLRRERVQLVETFSREFKQPYHAAEKMEFEAGRKHIEKVKSEAQRFAHRSLKAMQSELENEGYRLGRCGLLVASGRPLPSLDKILASHALIHNAEGELFREVLASACGRCGIEVFRVREKELIACAAQSLECTETAVLKRATELGRSLGSPWSQDQKFAALAASLVLSGSRTGKLTAAGVESA
jgi:hypothetical protein